MGLDPKRANIDDDQDILMKELNYYIFENDELGSFVFDGHYYIALTVNLMLY